MSSAKQLVSSDSQGHYSLSRFATYLSQNYRHYLSSLLPDIGLSLSNYYIVLYLWHHQKSLPNGASQTQLSDNTLNDKAAVARGVKKLLELGYVDVASDPTNSSRNIVSLTNLGKSIGKQLNSWVLDWEEEALSFLPAKRRTPFLDAFRELFFNMRNESHEKK